jgi:hypothetical protein
MRSRLRLVATAAFLASLVSTAASAENRTTIQITAVRGTSEGRTFDPRLASLKPALKPLRLGSYYQVGTETRVLHGNGGQFGMDLPNGRYLHITTREHTPNHLRLHILLNENNHPVVNTYVKLELGSVVLMGGPRDENGTLVITIGSRPWRDEDEDAPVARKPTSRSSDAPAPGSAPQGAASAPGSVAKPSGSSRELPPKASTPPTPAVSAVLPVAPASPAH